MTNPTKLKTQMFKLQTEELFLLPNPARARENRPFNCLYGESAESIPRHGKIQTPPPHANAKQSSDSFETAKPAQDRELRRVRIAVLEKLLFETLQRAAQSAREYAEELIANAASCEDERSRERSSKRRMHAEIKRRILELELLSRELL